MTHEPFESMLTGGHPNSLGRTIEVVEVILANPERLEELYQCYFSDDEVVRLRTSNAFKRITKEHPDWFEPYIDRFLDTVSQINQPSAQWTLAQLMMLMQKRLSDEQLDKAKSVLKQNLESYSDWIVLNFTMEALTRWAKKDEALKTWLKPRLDKLRSDGRKSVANRANKYYNQLYV